MSSVIIFKSKDELAYESAIKELKEANLQKVDLTGDPQIDGRLLSRAILAQLKVTRLKKLLQDRGLL